MQASSDDRWRRAQAYRSERHTPRGDAWRAQAQALAQHSWQRYLQVAPNAAKLAQRDPGTRAAVQGILRDIQIARVSLNDRQVRAKAGELRVITDYLRQPNVARVRVIPSSSAGRTPDLLVTTLDGKTHRVEVRTLAQGAALGSRRQPGVPGRTPATVEGLAQAIAAKARRGQLTSRQGAMSGVAPGGTIVIRLEARGPAANELARQAMNQLDSQLKRWPHVKQVAVHTGSQRIVFERLKNGNFLMRSEVRGPPSTPAPKRRARSTARRATPRQRAVGRR